MTAPRLPRRLGHPLSGGEPSFDASTATDLPSPSSVTVALRCSFISGGTERSTRHLASSSLISKARERPDLVRKVIDRARTDGLGGAVAVVRRRHGESIPLGYSGAGEVLAVNGLRVGQRVATAGVGHGEIQATSANLTVLLPEGVSFEEGAFRAVASIAMNGVRLAEIGPGDRVLIVGLGLVEQLAARLVVSAGGIVAGIDLADWKRHKAIEADVTSFPADDLGWEVARDWVTKEYAWEKVGGMMKELYGWLMRKTLDRISSRRISHADSMLTP